MSRGVVLFAFNNEATDYVGMATWSAARIHRYLNLPVCLITDRDIKHNVFDHIVVSQTDQDGQRWMPDHNGMVSWKNFYRYQVYDLSPFDDTLLLDVDYVVSSHQLNTLWDIDQDILVMGKAHDLAHQTDFSQHNFFGRFAMKSAWATVIKFKRTITAQSVFDIMRRVQENWMHYRNLYGIGQSKFRNDFALAIAMNVTHGNTGAWPEIPWSMPTSLPDYEIVQLEHDRFEIVYKKPNGACSRNQITHQDFHAMNKRCLGDIIATSS